MVHPSIDVSTWIWKKPTSEIDIVALDILKNLMKPQMYVIIIMKIIKNAERKRSTKEILN